MFKLLLPLLLVFAASCKKDSATSNIFSFDARNDTKLYMKMDLIGSLEDQQQKVSLPGGGLYLSVSAYDETTDSFKAVEVSRKGSALGSSMKLSNSDLGSYVPLVINSQLAISTSLGLVAVSEPVYKFTVATAENTELLKTISNPKSDASSAANTVEMNLSSTIATEMILESKAPLTNTESLNSFKDIVKTIETTQIDAESKLAKSTIFTPETLIASLKIFIASSVLTDTSSRDKINTQLAQAGANNVSKGWASVEKIVTEGSAKVDEYSKIFQEKNDMKTVVTTAQQEIITNPASGSTTNTGSISLPSPSNSTPDTAAPMTGIITGTPGATKIKLQFPLATDDITPQNALEYKIVYSYDSSYIDTIEEVIAVNGSDGFSMIALNWSILTNGEYIVAGLSQMQATVFSILVRDQAGNISWYGFTTISTTSDNSAPVVGSIATPMLNSVEATYAYARYNLSWSAASDDDPLSVLEYKVIMAPEGYIATPGQASSCSPPCKTLINWTPAISTIIAVPYNTRISLHIVVRDDSGNMSLYPAKIFDSVYLSAAVAPNGNYMYGYIYNGVPKVFQAVWNSVSSTYGTFGEIKLGIDTQASSTGEISVNYSTANTPFVLYAKEIAGKQEVYLKEYDGTAWVQDGTFSTNIATGTKIFPHISADTRGAVYASFQTYQSGDRYQHMKYISNPFTAFDHMDSLLSFPIAASFFYSGTDDMYWFGGPVSGANVGKKLFQTYNNGSGYTNTMSGVIPSTARGEIIGDAGNMVFAQSASSVYAAYYDPTGVINVAKFNGMNMTSISSDLSNQQASNVSLVHTGTDLYLMYKDNYAGGTLKLKKYDTGTTWIDLSPIVPEDDVAFPTMRYEGGKLIITGVQQLSAAPYSTLITP